MTRRAVLILVLASAAGCLWRSYAAIMSVHLDVLTQTAAKLCDLAASERGPDAQGMGEYIYPAQRAREFLHQFDSERQRVSYQRFVSLLDRYEAFVREIDRLRAQAGELRSELPRFTAERDTLMALADAIRADLRREA